MAIALIVLAAVLVFAIAATVIGREAHRLDAVAPRVVYDLDQAVAFVVERVPESTAARLTPDDVRELLRLHRRRLHTQGLWPDVAEDQVQDIAEPVVLDELDETAWVLGEAEQSGLDVDDGDVAAVIDLHLDYLDAIGAVGPAAAGEFPEEPKS